MSGRQRLPSEREGLVELHGWHAVLEALRAGRRPLVRLRMRKGLRRGAELLAVARQAGVEVEEVDPEELARAAPAGTAHQGVALLAGPLPGCSLAGLLAGSPAPRTLLALDGVEDPQNLGAIARVAEAAGANGLVLTRRHAPPLGAAVSRASAGAIEWLPVARVPNLVRALRELRDLGAWVFGLDSRQGDDLFSIPDRILSGDRVLVLGAEGRGLRPGVAAVLDHRIRISLAGQVSSLNVAAAAAIALFEIRRRAMRDLNPAGTNGAATQE